MNAIPLNIALGAGFSLLLVIFLVMLARALYLMGRAAGLRAAREGDNP